MIRRPTRQKRQYQIDFRDWLKAADFHGHSITARRTVHYVQIDMAGLHPALRVRLQPFNLAVDVYWNGKHVDRIFDEDMMPKVVENEFVCVLCQENPERTTPVPRFSSISEMREDHLFCTFRAWVVEKLRERQHFEVAGTQKI